jgi:hypothetical protein
MKKSLKHQEAKTVQHLDSDVVCPFLTLEEKENSENLQNVLAVCLLMLDKLSLEIGSQDRLLIAYHSVRQILENNKIKQEVLDKLIEFMEKRRKDNILVKIGFY